jgi:ArsR family transcriptional regulator
MKTAIDKTGRAASQLLGDPHRATRAAEMVKALGHPLRLQIVALLCSGAQHVSAIAQRLDCPQAILSQQLRILRVREVVRVTRANGFSYYRLAQPGLKNFVRCIAGCSCN